MSIRKLSQMTIGLVSILIATCVAGNASATDAVPPPPTSYHFVLVHGAWHGGWSWFQTQTRLEKQGHEVTVVELPSHGTDKTDPATVTMNDYAQVVIDCLDAAADPVILVGHSMGGIVISTATEARPAKVSKLVYLAAFMVPAGVSMLDLAMTDVDSVVGANLIVGPGIIDVAETAVEEAFYGKSPAWVPRLAETLLVPNPIQPIATPLTLTDANYGSVRRFYIKTAYDKAITPALQERMLLDLPCEAEYLLNSDHSPFFSKTKKLVATLLEAADA